MPGYVWPVALANKITSAFGSRTAPTSGASTNHKGIDISARIGTSVAAAFDGTISKIGYNALRGNYVVLDDGSGTQALYQHLSQALGAVGDKVAAGQIIAKTGDSGTTTGPHLHFEILKNGTSVDPQTFEYNSPGDSDALEAIINKHWWMIAGALLLIGILK